MTHNHHSSADNLPVYVKFWNYLKLFPHILAVGSKSPPNVSGPAAAALVSAAFSCFILMVNQHFTSAFKEWDKIIWQLGYWIPGSHTSDPVYGEIGSYSGKETVMLIVWLASWFVLGKIWQHQQIRTKTMLFCLFIFMVAATFMNWHPLFPYLPLMPK